MEAAPPLTLPGWNALFASSMYTKQSDQPHRTDVLALYCSNLPSVPQCIDRLVKAAERPVQHRRRAKPPTFISGTLEEHIHILPTEMRIALSKRDHRLVARVQRMIGVLDEQLRVRPLRLLHIEYGQLPDTIIERTRRIPGYYTPENWIRLMQGMLDSPNAYAKGCGNKWFADIELDDQRGLRSDSPILRVMEYRNRQPRKGSPKTKAHVDAIAAAAYDAPLDQLAMNKLLTMGNTESVFGSSLIPVIYHLAAGGRGRAPAMSYWAYWTERSLDDK